MEHEIIEMCGECGFEAHMELDVARYGFQIHCPNCGKRMMLCDECLHSHDNPRSVCNDEMCAKRKGVIAMTTEQAVDNDVCAAACCSWCVNAIIDGDCPSGECKCAKIGSLTFLTDVCRNFEMK